MKIVFIILSALVLISWAEGTFTPAEGTITPTEGTFIPTETPKTIVIKAFPEDWLVHTDEYDIISMSASIYCNESSNYFSIPVYFVKGEAKPDGGYNYKGLYQLDGGKVKLILDKGQAIAPSNDERQLVFIGASDGIYVYNEHTDKTEKYGTLTANILNIAKEVSTDMLYVLTDDHFIYKVTEGGTKRTKIEGIQQAHEFVLDNSNNLYFWGDDKLPFVYNEQGIKKIEGLPSSSNYAKLIKAPFFIKEDTLYMSDADRYTLTPRGARKITYMKFEIQPSAYALEAYFFHYYAFQKKIYKYNNILPRDIIENMKNTFLEHLDTIQCIDAKLQNKQQN